MPNTDRRSAKPPVTSRMNLHRLEGVPATREGLHQAVKPIAPDTHPEFKDLTVAGCPAVLVTAWRIRDRVQWDPVIGSITGEDPGLGSMTPDCLLLLAIDEHAYAITFGRGAALLDPTSIEAGFGLRFAVRVLDPQRIGALIRNPLTGQGRVDHTRVAGGADVTAFGILPWGNLIRSFSGRGAAHLLPTTGRLSGRQPSLTGSDVLVIRLGCAPEDLVADIREIARICELASPIPELEFATRIRQLSSAGDAALIAELEVAVDEMLGSTGGVEFSIPHQALATIDEARAFAVKIGGRRDIRTELELADILAKTMALAPGQRMKALHGGYIGCFADEDGLEPLDGAAQIRAVRWITAEVSMGADRYVLLDGRWYRIGAEHLESMKAKVKEILDRPAPVDLPPWPGAVAEEKDYLVDIVKATLPGIAILDRKKLHSRQHRRGIEACDIFQDAGQVLVHVKKAVGSAVLSHLFNQAMVSADALRNEADARELFAERVKEASDGAIVLDAGFVPVNVCLAIKWKNGLPVTAESLPTFAQVALLQLDYMLGGSSLTVTSIKE